MYVRSWWVASLLLGACQCGDDDPPTGSQVDGVIIAPLSAAEYGEHLQAEGVGTLLVPFTDASTDIVDIANEAEARELELILGLSPSRPAEAEWNLPRDVAPDLEDALDRALLARARLAGVHLDHAEPGAPDPDMAAYLDATVALIRTKTETPISFAIRSRAITSMELQNAGFPVPPAGTTADDLVDRPTQIAWANGWGELLGPRVDRVILHTTATDDRARVLDELALLRQNLTGTELWVSVDPLQSTRGAVRPMSEPRAVAEEIAAYRAVADRVLLRGLEALEPTTALTEPRLRTTISAVADSGLERRANDMDARMRRCCLRDGQIVTVYDGKFDRDRYANLWQEDACWLTSLYASAMAFRFAVTQEPEAEAEARAAFEAIHQMANTTPMKGEVVRNYVRTLYAQTEPVAPGADTIKRWRRATDRELYWVGDISVDQLSGWFNGMLVYHELVANDAERALIREDVTAVLDMFLDNDLHAIEFTGARTTFGDLRAQPLLALSFFQIGHYLTGDQRYRDQMLQLMDEDQMHYAIANVLSAYHQAERFGSDHFYSSGFYPLLILETDPEVMKKLDLALQMFQELKRRHGDAYADTVYAVFHPTSDTARRAARELIRYRPELSENAGWFREVGQHTDTPFDPIERRAAAELDFDYVPPGTKGRRGGLEFRFPGVGYMLPYWMARYHGLLQIE